MATWRSYLKADPTEWLLEPDNPSVRYFTLLDVLKCSPKDADVASAKRSIMRTGVVPRILARQKRGGYWGKAEDFYVRAKYRGTVWQFIMLAELGADGRDPRIRRACEFALNRIQDRESGGFAYRGHRAGGRHDCVIPCLTGNMVWSLVRFGLLEDPRVRRGIDWITRCQRFDDGDGEAPRGWPYDNKEACWGRHTCHMGAVKALNALAEIPPRKRSREVRGVIEQGTEYLLKHHIFRQSHDLRRVSRADWLRFGFPLMWRTNALDILGILTRLGGRDRRMQEAIDLVVSKQDARGRWKLETTFNGRVLVNIEREGEPSKWVTLNALRALKGFYS